MHNLLHMPHPGLPFFLSAIVFSQSLASEIRSVVDIVALAVLFGGMFILARYKASLDAADKATTAVERERDAELERANRLEKTLTRRDATIATLEARPNLARQQEMLETLIKILQGRDDLFAKLVDASNEQTALLRQILARN